MFEFLKRGSSGDKENIEGSLAGAEMTAHFREEHKKIISVFNSLVSYIIGEAVAKVDVIKSLRELKSTITHHIDSENKYLYFRLKQVKAGNTAATAKKSADEMIKIGERIFAFFDRYLHLGVSELETNKGFRKELGELSGIFTKRQQIEERVIFPLYEKYCGNAGEKKKEKPSKEEIKTSEERGKRLASLSRNGKAYMDTLEKMHKEVVHKEIKKARKHIKHIKKIKQQEKPIKEYIKTGIPGFDELFENGIPKGYSIIVAGGAGSGKTIMLLQTVNYHCSKGEKCIYMSLEESEDRLREHMADFGWDAEKYEKQGLLKIQRINPFDITRSVDALLEKAKGRLLIDVDPIIIPKGFKPDIIIIDSLTAIASAFTGKEDSYRIYIEQLFRFFENIGATTFLITETEQVPKIFSQTGVEEFLADGVIVLYSIKRGNIREKAVEVLKLRGAKHEHKIVAMEITSGGVTVYPQQEVFGGLEES